MEKKRRCGWLSNDEIYLQYHDIEWGRPVHQDRLLFEFLLLESFQAGLSWLTVLKKRENFRAAFDAFNYNRIADYNESDRRRLMQNAGIIRNKLKIEAAINNARAFQKVVEEKGSFNNYIWSFVEFKPIKNHYRTSEQLPPNTALSDFISKDLKRRNFKFVGTTIIYSFMQAIGMVNDHTQECYLYNEILADRE